MAKLKGPFYFIDQEIFKQIETFLSSQSYQKINEELASLSDEKKKILNYVLTISTILLPLFIVFFMATTNSSMRADIKQRKQILDQIYQFGLKSEHSKLLSSASVSPHQITNKAGLQNRIKRALERKKIPADKVVIKSFEQTKGEIKKTDATLDFRGFTTNNLNDFLVTILQNEKMKIISLEIKKNNTEKLLKGSLQILHYGK